MFRSLLREPLVHFLLLGAALFAIDAWLRPAAGSDANLEIVVSEARVNNLAQNFRRIWQRPPTRPELDNLVEEFIREEVLYREALALGMDRDDTIIRRRLRQKIEFVSDEAAGLARPDDRELEEYLAAHSDAFRVEPRVTFAQVYLDPRRRAKTLDADARRLLDQLNRPGAAADPTRFSDRLQLLEASYANVAQSEVARVFGADFADALAKQPSGRWVGPIASGYGVHLVRLDSITPGGVASLEEVRPLVEREWSNAKRTEVKEAVYQQLRGKYRVTVGKPGAAGSEGKQTGTGKP